MMQAVRYFFLHLSVALLLAHSLVPHQHEAEDAPLSLHNHDVATSPSVFDWFASLFGQDLGEDHLQNYRPSSELLTAYLPALFNHDHQREYNGRVILIQQLAYLPYQDQSPDDHALPATANRGPPQS